MTPPAGMVQVVSVVVPGQYDAGPVSSVPFSAASHATQEL